MKKQELIKSVSERTELTQKTVKDVLDSTENVICEVLKNEDEISVMGVKFATRLQKGREGISAFNGATWKTEDKIVPRLKPMKSLKDACLK